MIQAPDEVSVYEVSPRDGLQNEKATVPLGEKLRLIEALTAAGLRRIEATSFVSPKWIPQLADADDVARALPRIAAGRAVTYSALVPNARGLERAKAAGMTEIAVFLSASETHNQKNVNKSVAETLDAFEQTIGPARTAGMRVRGYVSTVWGCPYEGAVDPKKALEIAKRLLAMGCYQISLGDTIGVGTPVQTQKIVTMMLAEIPREALALHMHDTRGTALANILAGLELGIRDFDASVGGLGGCPFSPNSTGNIATEDLVWQLERDGVATGIDVDALVGVARRLEDVLGHRLDGAVHRAADWPQEPSEVGGSRGDT